MLCVIYNTMQFFFSLQSNDGPVFTMRVVFPLVSCILSYINVYMIIILNKDMRKKVLQLFHGRHDGSHSQTALISIGNRSRSSVF
ncbi:unnamed protein product [Cylicocyclus nassatus]|uniref:Uncharacterized protein n=1 Tax=Cylicocyclus nassatus TaxID=53992 RepID=A0AA36MAP0_CYLNA|nr:unnamed protein product [Cylicocyclus nassatus]